MHNTHQQRVGDVPPAILLLTLCDSLIFDVLSRCRDFQNSVDEIEERFARWKRFLDSHQTAGNAEFQNLKHGQFNESRAFCKLMKICSCSDLRRDLSDSIQKLDFLDKTLMQIESKREQFKHIDEVRIYVPQLLSCNGGTVGGLIQS